MLKDLCFEVIQTCPNKCQFCSSNSSQEKKTIITLEDFNKIDIRVGTIIDASINKGARKKAYKLKIDFGSLGIKNSSAQITDLYKEEELIEKQIIAVVNIESIHISEVTSEVLVLGVVTNNGVVLLNPDTKVENGTKIL